MPRYYLDTTALIERWAGEPAARDAVRRYLRNESHATSTHVRREWVRLIEGTAADVINAINDGEEDLTAIFARLSQGWGREQGQRLRILAMLAGGKRQVNVTELRTRSQQLLRTGSQELFEHHLDEVRDSSECGLARNRVEASRGGRLKLIDTCKRTDDICRQDQFVAENEGSWAAASQGLAEHGITDADRKMGKVGIKVGGDPPIGKGKNCYGRTGDISISVECGEGETLLTTDRSFEAIAKARRISVTRFQGTAPP